MSIILNEATTVDHIEVHIELSTIFFFKKDKDLKLVLFLTIAIFKHSALFTVNFTQSFIDTEMDPIRLLELNL